LGGKIIAIRIGAKKTAGLSGPAKGLRAGNP